MVPFQKLLLERRFVVAMFYPLSNPQMSAENHFTLGLSCCALIKPHADYMRLLHGEVQDIPESPYAIRRDTHLVQEGYRRLRILNVEWPQFSPPATLEPVIAETIQDLMWHAREEFHDCKTPAGYPDPRSAAWSSIVLLDRLVPVHSTSDAFREHSAFRWGQTRMEKEDLNFLKNTESRS